MKIVNFLFVVSLLACISYLAIRSDAKKIVKNKTIRATWYENYGFRQKFQQGFDKVRERAFSTFQRAYNRTYSPQELGQRMKLFMNRFQTVKSWNAQFVKGKVSYSLRANHFADRTDRELATMNGLITPKGLKLRSISSKRLKAVSANLPDKVDYSVHKCNPRIRDQEDCGSCYAFATAEMVGITRCLESGNPSTYGDSRSPQHIVDCGSVDKDYGSHMNGCNGGWPYHVLKYLRKTNGLAEESDYPYKARQGTCKKEVYGYSLPGWSSRDSFHQLESEDEFKEHLAKYGPVVAAIRATSHFHMYESGIFDDTTCRNGPWNHAVLVIGYGRESGKDFWLIKNSHGEDWGDKGYMKMIRGKHSCQIGKMGWGIPY